MTRVFFPFFSFYCIPLQNGFEFDLVEKWTSEWREKKEKKNWRALKLEWQTYTQPHSKTPYNRECLEICTLVTKSKHCFHADSIMFNSSKIRTLQCMTALMMLVVMVFVCLWCGLIMLEKRIQRSMEMLNLWKMVDIFFLSVLLRLSLLFFIYSLFKCMLVIFIFVYWIFNRFIHSVYMTKHHKFVRSH